MVVRILPQVKWIKFETIVTRDVFMLLVFLLVGCKQNE